MTAANLARVRRTEPFIGTWLSIGSPIIAELASAAGFDWLLFDLEHGAHSDAVLMGNLQAIKGSAAMAIVRVGAPHPDLILRALDWGSAGIMVPHVESAAEAASCLLAMHYPPRGRRGISRSARVYEYGLRPMPAPEDLPPPLLFAQIETLRGIERVGEIAAVEGVDVLFVGPADLAFDLSVRRNGDGPGPQYDDCLSTVTEAARASGKQAGILVRTLDDIPALRARGFTHFAVESDLGIIRSRYQQVLKETRRVCA
jgi:2-dehydro-3-deoxyglucarate aldolase/4-hydroxy-2-oxoheptanedioate aldolase